MNAVVAVAVDESSSGACCYRRRAAPHGPPHDPQHVGFLPTTAFLPASLCCEFTLDVNLDFFIQPFSAAI
jgi:hypothetical protein